MPAKLFTGANSPFYKRHVTTVRTISGGWVDRKAVTRGPNGRGLCRWCALEVPRGRYTFCSTYCVHEWRLRSQPGYLREQVFLRDRGICAICSVDTIAAAFAFRTLGTEEPHPKELVGCRPHSSCSRRRGRVRPRKYPHSLPAVPSHRHTAAKSPAARARTRAERRSYRRWREGGRDLLEHFSCGGAPPRRTALADAHFSLGVSEIHTAIARK